MKKLLAIALMTSSIGFAQQQGLGCGDAIPSIKQYIQVGQNSLTHAEKSGDAKEIISAHSNFFAALALLKFACPQNVRAIQSLDETISLIDQAVAQP